MPEFIKKVEVRWADLDPNFHMLHSKYSDLGAYCRMAFLVEKGLTPNIMLQNNIGPILFREECIFKKEILFGDDVSINLEIKKVSDDYSRWSMIHEIRKNGDNIAAIISIDGAWIDTVRRKLTLPPPVIIKIFEDAPKAGDFIMYTKEKGKP